MHSTIALTLAVIVCLSCSSKQISHDGRENESFLTPSNHGEDTGHSQDESGSGHANADDTAHQSEDCNDEGEHEVDSDEETEDGFPLDGIGDITGDCNVISLPEDSGLWIHNSLNFGSDVFDETLLSHGGSALFEAGTLGGSSIHSEVIAFEVLHRCEIAFLVKTEGEIEYSDNSGKKTDMLVEIDGLNVGVSVTRAFKWGEGAIFTEEDAHTLLSDKLEDVLLSGSNASATNPWSHAILHVIAYDPSYVESLEAAYTTLPASLVGDTIVVITVTEGNDEFLY